MATETVSYQIKIDADTKSLKTLEQELKDINKETLELKETNQLFKQELIELENRYKKLPNTALGAKKKLKEQITDLKGAIKENNIALQNFTIDKQQKKQLINDLAEVHNEVGHSIENFAGFGAAIGETVAGFMLLSGASEENTEKLEHAIGTVMAFEGVAEGVIHAQKLWNTTIKNSTILTTINSTATKMSGAVQKLFAGSINQTSFAFKGLKTAIIATGIGALVVAVGLLIANFDKLKGAINGVSKAQEGALEDQEKAVELAEKRLDAISDQENILKLQGKSERDILNMKIQEAKLAIEESKTRLEMQRDINHQQIEAEERNRLYLENIVKGIFIIPRTILKGVDLIGEGLNKLFKEIQQIPFAKKILGEEPINIDFKLAEMADGGIDSIAGLIFNAEETKEKAEETEQEIDDALIRLENQLAGFELSKRDMDQKTADELKKIRDKVNEDAINSAKAREAVEIDSNNILIEEKKSYWETLGELQLQASEKERLRRQKELEDEIALQDAKLSMATQGIGALIHLNNAFAKDNEKSQRRAFERNKKLQIAQAIISTYQGANAIFSSAAANPATVLFPAQPFIAAGIAIVSGLANVAQISKQQFQSSSSGGGGNVSAPNFGLGGGGGISAPSLGPTNQSTLIPQDEDGNSMQVFVTETDITNTQNKVNVIETQATF